MNVTEPVHGPGFEKAAEMTGTFTTTLEQHLRARVPHLAGIRLPSLAIFAAGYIVSVLVSEHAFGSLAVSSPLWLPDSVFLCALLLTPKKHWWAYLLSVWVIRILIGAVPGTPAWFLVSSLAIDSASVFFAAWWLHRVWRRPGHFTSFREFIVYQGVAAVAAPLFSAILATPVRHALGDPVWSAGYRWFLGDCVAQAVVTPALLLWCTRSYRRTNSRLGELFLLCSALIAVMAYSFFVPLAPHSGISLYVPVPFLIWAAVRLRPFGTANAIGLVACVAMFSAVEGVGVFAGNSPHDSELSIQLFLLVIAIPLLSLAILNAERESKVEELTALLAAAPIAILVAEDAECRRITTNRTGSRIYDVQIGTNLSKSAVGAERLPYRITRDGIAVPPDELPVQRAAKGITVNGESYTLELEDGTKRHILGNAAPLFGEDGKPRGAIGVYLDFTQQKEAEDMLRESEERFRQVADTAPVLLWMSDENRLRTFFNNGWLEFTGRSIEQELGNGWLDGVHPDDLQLRKDACNAAFASHAEYKLEYRLRRFDGEFRWIVVHGMPRFDLKGVFCGYIGSCIDIEDRKLAESSLRELSGRLIHAQELERARIARELHDDFGQRMALLQMEIERIGLDDEIGLTLDARHQLLAVAGDASRISSDIHGLSHQLHPSKLALGLVIALKSFCREFSAQHRMNIQFAHENIPKEIPGEVTLCVYRIVQESLRNAVKYSKAAEATVELSEQDGRILVCISDLGVGFDPESESRKSGLGLISMRERLWQVGGTLLIHSEPSRGTRIRASVPITPAGKGSRGKAHTVGI